MAEYSFKLPDLGEGTVESEIVAWHAAIGAAVKTDEPLVDVMTDKATIEITAPVSGTLIFAAGEPGDIISVGAELAVFTTESEQSTGDDEEGDDLSRSSFPHKRESSETTDHIQDDTSGRENPANRPQTSPAIRRLAKERGIDLNRIIGTGPNGRITRADLEKIDKVAALNSAAAESHAGLDQSGKPSVAETEPDETGVHEIKLVGLRRKIAEQMSLSASRIPHFSYVEEVDVTDLEQLRRRLNETRQENRPELTYLPFLMLALVKAVRQFPRCNAHFDDGKQVIREFKPVHIGIAVQTQDGLLVPVIRDAQTLDLWQCAAELKDIAERAQKRARPQGGTQRLDHYSLQPGSARRYRVHTHHQLPRSRDHRH